MSEMGSVTVWIHQLKANERDAVEALWQRYFHRLIAFARRQLSTVPRTASNEEDVALSAFFSFFKAVEAGRFPQLDDRHDLWQVLVMLTRRKAISLKKFESRERRDFRRLQQQSAASADKTLLHDPVFAELISQEPDPTFVTEMLEQRRYLLDKLEDQELQQIAEWKLEGYTNGEIAERLNWAESTIERRLQLIRKCWEDELPTAQN
ncbi:MAG: ECF-type sigma factor [Gemmataceae bacterium]